MVDRDEGRREELRRNVVEKMWLNYFNNTLLEQGLISASMHRKMKVQISTRKPTNRVRDTVDLELNYWTPSGLPRIFWVRSYVDKIVHKH